MLMEMGMLMRTQMIASMKNFITKIMRGKIGIEEPIVLMALALLAGLFRSILFMVQVIGGILSGHLFPSF